jgi:HSP20 family protein
MSLESLDRFNALEQLQDVRRRLEALTRSLAGAWVPSADIIEEEDHFRLLVDLPGVRPEDLELKEEDSTLTLAGVRHPIVGTYNLQERPSGHFQRSFDFGQRIQPGSAQASLKGGVLEVIVKKAMD